MDSLPDTVFLEIFSYFNICEKLRCSAVSRRWQRLVYDWKLWQEIDVKNEWYLYRRLTDEMVKNWGLAWGPQILKLNLNECNSLTDQAVCYIGELCPNLRTLNLKNCTQVSDLAIIELSNFCFKLREIDLYFTRVTELGFQSLVENNPGLENFRLPTQGNCRWMIDSICQNCDNVKELVLRDSIGEDTFILDDDTFRRFSERFPMLRKLHLSWCCEITNQTLDWISRNCVTLRSLCVQECEMISDDGIRLIAERCPFLDDLHLDRQSLVNDTCCYTIRDHLSHIQSLELVHTSITDLGIEVIATNAENLRTLCISGSGVSLQSIQGQCLPMIAEKCKRLEKLHMYFVKIDDNRLVRVCKNLLQLRDLRLGVCEEVSRAGIRELAEKCRKLTQLQLYDCPSFRDCHLEIMAKRMPQLRRLEILGSHEVTEDGANQFAEIRPDCFLNV